MPPEFFVDVGVDGFVANEDVDVDMLAAAVEPIVVNENGPPPPAGDAYMAELAAHQGNLLQAAPNNSPIVVNANGEGSAGLFGGPYPVIDISSSDDDDYSESCHDGSDEESG